LLCGGAAFDGPRQVRVAADGAALALGGDVLVVDGD
jgi:hypothetical protein